MWRFKDLERGTPERDPHEAEFFRLTEPAEAVVREVIQNSLDARSGADPVRVRFTFGNADSSDTTAYLSRELERHLEACDLLPSGYNRSAIVPFLTIEDFGTTGLDGATGEDGARPEVETVRSNFYSFWWCEGKSPKSGREAGRWGLGKTTFHLASKVRSFWGLTVRQDDSRTLLMGKALLRTHRLNNSVYAYYAYFTEEDDSPLQGTSQIADFAEKFSLSRDRQPGLSLVMPLPLDEITQLSVIRSVVTHYSYAIMKGILQVEVGTCDCWVDLRAETLMHIAHDQLGKDTAWETVDIVELLHFIKESMDAAEGGHIVQVARDRKPERWFGERLDEFKVSFNKGDLIAFRIPITVKPVNYPPLDTHFDIFLRKYLGLSRAEELYIRSGITITDIHAIGNRPLRAMLVAEDTPITTFLGDAETPSHTQWNERTEKFREKYEDAVGTLRFIRRSMAQIAALLDEPPKERQTDFLKDIFFVRDSDEDERGKTVTEPPQISVHSTPAPFQIVKTTRGFRIALARPDTPLPLQAAIRLGYDVRRGNPFKQYDQNDFDLGGSSMHMSCRGCMVLFRHGNSMKIQVMDPDFELELMGFDPKRDLVVSVTKVEGEQVNETNTELHRQKQNTAGQNINTA